MGAQKGVLVKIATMECDKPKNKRYFQTSMRRLPSPCYCSMKDKTNTCFDTAITFNYFIFILDNKKRITIFELKHKPLFWKHYTKDNKMKNEYYPSRNNQKLCGLKDNIKKLMRRTFWVNTMLLSEFIVHKFCNH